MIDVSDKSDDALVLPAETVVNPVHPGDDFAAPHQATTHVLLDDLAGPWMLIDPLAVADDLSAGHHRSDWM